jgi:ABC-2 type transport system permease protein
MNKTFLVLRHEMLTIITSKSFLFTAFALPLLGVLIFLGVSLLKGGTTGAPTESDVSPDPPQLQVEGYVDPGGLIKVVHPEVPEGILVAYPDEASARQALKTGEIAAYYIIPTDYVERGDLIYVNPDYSWTSRGQSWVMRQTIFANLLGNDPQRIAQAARPMDVQVTALAPEHAPRDEDNRLAFYVPYATMMIFYLVLIMAASLLLNSVSKEKKDRTMEVLLLSVTPRQMLTGKIVGLGLLGLLQNAIWVGTGYTLLRLSGQTFSRPAGFELAPSILGWGLLLFLLGYAVYASLMAGLGALAPNLQEATQAIIVVIWPLLIPLFFFVPLIEKPHGALAVGLSLFPLTAPVALMTRLAAGDVPLWQLLLATVLLGVTAALIVGAVARLFRAQTLLSGQPFSVKRFLNALLVDSLETWD